MIASIVFVLFCALRLPVFVTAIPSRYADEEPIVGLENGLDVSEGPPADFKYPSATTKNVPHPTTENASPTTRGRQPWSKLGRGFFGGPIRNKCPDKAAKDKTVKDNVGRKRKADALKTSRVHSFSSRTLFGNWTECSAANPGRSCVCYIPDFLDKIGDKLEDIYDATDDRSVTAKVVALKCPSYRAVPEAFVVEASPVPKDRVTLGATDVQVSEHTGHQNVTVSVSKEVNFENDVINHFMEKSTDDHFAVHYTKVGSHVKIQCVKSEIEYAQRIHCFKWKYKKNDDWKSSRITARENRNLTISHMEPKDTKNYTCIPTGKSEGYGSFIHYVIAIEHPKYKIRGTVIYETSSDSGCTPEIIQPVRIQLPNIVRNELCPEGAAHYVCIVEIRTLKCVKNEMKIVYSVTFNEKSVFLNQLKIHKKSRHAVYQQKLLARISQEFTENLHQILNVKLTIRVDGTRHFKPVDGGLEIQNFAMCEPGFGIREIFCAACPPHHYSPDKSGECFKCKKGFRQPNAGSENCIECDIWHLFDTGCLLELPDMPLYMYYLWICIIMTILLVLLVWLMKNNEEDDIPNVKWTRNKDKVDIKLSYSDLQKTKEGIIQRKLKKFKKQMKFGFNKKQKFNLEGDPRWMNKFDNEHRRTGEQILRDKKAWFADKGRRP